MGKRKNCDDRLEIFRLVIKHNQEMTQADIRGITGKPERTVSYWFAEERTPDDMSLYLIRYALMASKRNIPRELDRLIGRMIGKARYWGEKNRSGCEAPTRVGNKKIAAERQMQKREYIYRGEVMKLPEIAERAGLTSATLLARVVRYKKFPPGSDITEIADRKKYQRD